MDMAEASHMKGIIHITGIPGALYPGIRTQVYHPERPAGGRKIDPPGFMAVDEGINIIYRPGAGDRTAGQKNKKKTEYCIYSM
jgi:hypothetical protein